MKRTITTNKIIDAFYLIASAKVSTLENADKIKIWKIMRAFKPIASSFEDALRDAQDKFRPQDYTEHIEELKKYDQCKKDGLKTEIDAVTYKKYIEEMRSYDQLVGDAIQSDLTHENEVEFEPISSDVFELALIENGWDMSQAMMLEIIIND